MTSFRVSSPFSGATPGSTELAAWPRPTLAGDDADLRITLDRFDGPAAYPLRAGFERYLLPLRGSAVELTGADGACIARPRPGEVAHVPGETPLRAQPVSGSGSCALIVATVRRGRRTPSLQLYRLGSRELREPLAALALVLVTHGSLSLRATDEDEPLELDAGDCVWIEGARTGDELALAGRDEETELALVQLDA